MAGGGAASWRKLSISRPSSPPFPSAANSERSKRDRDRDRSTSPDSELLEEGGVPGGGRGARGKRGVKGGAARPASISIYSQQEVDELDGWLRRIERLGESTQPPRPILTPRSSRISGRTRPSTADSGGLAVKRDDSSTTTTLRSPPTSPPLHHDSPRSLASIQEAQAVVSSVSGLFPVSDPDHSPSNSRQRSHSHSSAFPGSSSISKTTDSSKTLHGALSSTRVNQSATESTDPHTSLSLTTAAPSSTSTPESPSRDRTLKRRSVPSPLPIHLSFHNTSSSKQRKGGSAGHHRRVSSASSGSEPRAEAGHTPGVDREKDLQSVSNHVPPEASHPQLLPTSPGKGGRVETTNSSARSTARHITPLAIETSPVSSPSPTGKRFKRRMTSPLSNFSFPFDERSLHSNASSSDRPLGSAGGSASSRAGGGGGPSSQPSQYRFQPRSPFTSRRPALSDRRFGSETDSDDNHGGEAAGLAMANDAGGSTSSREGPTTAKRRDYVTATQALADALSDTFHMQRRSSKDSFGSRKSSLFATTGNSASNASFGGAPGQPARDSIDSHASSSASFTHVRPNPYPYQAPSTPSQHRAPSSPATSTKPASSIASFQSSTNSADLVPLVGRRKLEARDDRVFPNRPRPRYDSTRSASSLPGDGGDDEHESDYLHQPARRASIPVRHKTPQGSSTELPSSSTLLDSTTKKTLPATIPPFARSQSYDARLSGLVYDSGVNTTHRDSSLPPHQRDMVESAHLWIPDRDIARTNASGGSVVGKGGKGLGRVLLASVPKKKSSSKRDSAQMTINATTTMTTTTHTEEGSSKSGRNSGKGKGKATEKITSVQAAGQWKRCEISLSPDGQLQVIYDHTFRLCVPITSLNRTDIRIVDQSVLGRQRVVALYTRGLSITSHQNPGTAPASNFPISPSAPDFGQSPPSSSQSFFDRPGSSKGSNSSSQVQPLPNASTFNEVYLAFPSAVTLHSFMAACLAHGRPEVYPSSAAQVQQRRRRYRDPSDGSEYSDDLQDEGDQAVDLTIEKPVTLPDPTSSNWRHKHHPSGSSNDAHELSAGASAEYPSAFPIRIYRSITLSIVEARKVSFKEGSVPSTHSFASLSSIAAHLPAPSATTNVVHEMRRTASIASGSAASTDSIEEISITTANTSSPLSSALASTSMPQAASFNQDSYPHSYSLTSKKSHSTDGHSRATHNKEDKDKDKDKMEPDMAYCELCLGDDVVGRTAVKKVAQTVLWQESFQVSNLGPFTQPLVINVYKIHKNRSHIHGSLTLHLQNYPRNHAVEDWFPLANYDSAKTGKYEALSELSMSIRIRKEVTMPANFYADLHDILRADGSHRLVYGILADHGTSIELDELARVLVRIIIHDGQSIPALLQWTEYELSVEREAPSVLFRRNTLLSKSVDLYMRVAGADYLEASIGEIIRKMCRDRVEVEIDPVRLQANEGSNGGRALQDNVHQLESWTSAIWNAVYNARNRCPSDLRRLFRGIQSRVERHYSEDGPGFRHNPDLTDSDRARIRLTCVSAFVFLRFLVPAVLNPRLFGLCGQHLPDAKTQRTLTLIAKTLQVMANMQSLGNKEPFMVTMNPWLRANTSSFEDFISYLCSTPTTSKPEWTSDQHDLYEAPTARRESLRPSIVREGVPSLPFLIDLPRELGNFASIVSRARNAEATRANERACDIRSDSASEGKPYDEIVTMCSEIHRQTEARFRTLERMGEIHVHGRITSNQAYRDLLPRSEGHRGNNSSARLNSTRNRGATISKATFHQQSSTTPLLSPAFEPSPPLYSSSSNSRDRMATSPPFSFPLYSSTPASSPTASPSSQVTSSPLQDTLADLSISSPPSNLNARRRSHTISSINEAASSHSTSPTISSTALMSKPLPAVNVGSGASEGDNDDILDIHLPSTTARLAAQQPSISSSAPETIPASSSLLSQRRSTITATRPNLLPVLSDSAAVPRRPALHAKDLPSSPPTSSDLKTPKADKSMAAQQQQQVSGLSKYAISAPLHPPVPFNHFAVGARATGIEDEVSAAAPAPEANPKKSSGKTHWYSRKEK